MAEAFVNVTEGSGKKLHAFDRTIGGTTVLDEVVLLGENYLASYIANSGQGSSSTATANSHLFQLMAGASLKVRVRRIEMYQIGLATTAVLMDTRLLRVTTAGTGGTAQNTNVLEPGDAASGATCLSVPGVKGTEGAIVCMGAAYMMQTVAASAQLVEPVLVWDFDRPRSKPLIIAAGTTNGIVVKNITAVAAGTVYFNVWFDETSF